MEGVRAKVVVDSRQKGEAITAKRGKAELVRTLSAAQSAAGCCLEEEPCA